MTYGDRSADTRGAGAAPSQAEHRPAPTRRSVGAGGHRRRGGVPGARPRARARRRAPRGRLDPGDVDPEFTLGRRRLVAATCPRPDAWRLEYQLTLRRGGDYEWTTDPGNPRRVPNPFGEKSEIRFPDYREPNWLLTAPAGPLREVETPAGRLDQPVPVQLWSPDGLPADSRRSAAGGARRVRHGRPRHPAVLGDGACPGTCRSGSRCSIRRTGCGTSGTRPTPTTPTTSPRWCCRRSTSRVLTGPVIGLGASLGALAMLALQRRHPGSISGAARCSPARSSPASSTRRRAATPTSTRSAPPSG